MENNENLKQELLALKELLAKYDNAYKRAVLTYEKEGFLGARKYVDDYQIKRKEFFDQLDQTIGTHLSGTILPTIFITGIDSLVGTIMLLMFQITAILVNKNNFKKMITTKKYLKENKASYETAKQTVKKYDTEIEPRLVKECHQLSDMIVEKVELIKRTSNVFAEFEDITRNRTVIYNTGLCDTRAIDMKILDQAFVKYGIERELEQTFVDYDVEPVQTQALENSKPKVRKLSQ